MSKKQKLASFCRLCLVKTTNKVPVFGSEEENVTNLLALIELNINPKTESNAAVCMDCIGILEGFCKFKEKCHDNNDYLKTHPPKDNADDSVVGEDDNTELIMECDYLEEDDTDEFRNGEKLILEKDVGSKEPPGTSKTEIIIERLTPRSETHKSTTQIATKRSVDVADPIDISGQVKIVRKQMAKPLSSSCKDIPVPKAPLEKYMLLPKFPGPQPTDDELPKLLDSYPDCLHFERRKSSAYFDLVYYGERYNSAIFTPNYTYWQCAHRKGGKCPAQVFVTNDYTEFERRYEHNHDDNFRKREPKVKPNVLTPQQALPAVFRICWYRVQQQKIRKEAAKRKKMEFKPDETLESGDKHRKKIMVNELIEHDATTSGTESDEDN